MSNLPSGASEAQMIDLFQNFKMPVMGAGGGFAPIGTVNFFDASIAPQGWLTCDGQTYNITDYPDLATYYASVHGSSNFYGGNGTTTFAVPDLRGEFLRGTGTNGHANQGDGANVGVHQDGTQVQNLLSKSGTLQVFRNNNDTNNREVLNYDKKIKGNSTVYIENNQVIGLAYDYPDRVVGEYTSRPTNTSFLICVKATIAGDPNGHVYSTEEQVVGTTEDGEYIYEITLKGNKPVNTMNQNVSIPVSGTIVSYAIDGYMKTSGGDLVKLGYWNNAQTDSFQVFVNTSNKRICILPTNLAGTYRFVYQYTKTS